MLKHATICRTSNRVQQALRTQWNEQVQASGGDDGRQSHPLNRPGPNQDALIGSNDDLNNNSNSLGRNGLWLAQTKLEAADDQQAASCGSSPTPSLRNTALGRLGSFSSAPSSVFTSPTKSVSSITACNNPTTIATNSTITRPKAESTIKIYAQTLSQEVEYVTLHVNAQTKSRQIVRTLLRKFRLKHRDPNLFYLTLERWIRKDGIKCKSVMLLSDNACPLQLQQCCSNPPHNDIKFTLQMRAGALLKIFCSDVCQNTKYKCLSLSTQTTAEETIELMLHCLNLLTGSDGKQTSSQSDTVDRSLFVPTNHTRQTSSPHSTGSSSSFASSNSSSSGIESDLTNRNVTRTSTTATTGNSQPIGRLDSNSRSSSITSISSSSNMSNTSSRQSLGELYCLVIEGDKTNYRRTLESDEYLVDVYQTLVDEARDQLGQSPNDGLATQGLAPSASSSASISEPIKRESDQWFVIKLKRREDLAHQSIKFTHPRQNMPLPPIPLSLSQINGDQHYVVSTTQIEVNTQTRVNPIQRRTTTTGASQAKWASAACNKPQIGNAGERALDTPDGRLPTPPVSTANSQPTTCHQRQVSEIVAGCSANRMPPPPATLVWLPPVKPRRRNLCNASSTFGRPQAGLSASTSFSRRRYDPAQLAEDLNQLNLTVKNDTGDAGPGETSAPSDAGIVSGGEALAGI